MTDLNTKKLLTVEDLAGLLKVKRAYVYGLTYSGQINFLKVGKYVRFDPDEVEDWLQSKKQNAKNKRHQATTNRSKNSAF